MMNKDSELILDPNELPITETLPNSSTTPTESIARELPKHLIDFKEYVDSKFCYNSVPLEDAELVSIDLKFAFQCQMKILMEVRYIHMHREPCWWENSRVLLSTTLGRYLDEPIRPGQPVGDIWNDYPFQLPETDERVKQEVALSHCTFMSRCDKCNGKRKKDCGGYNCGRSGEVCSTCGGSGKVICSECKGQGGFRNTPILKVRWHTRTSVCTLQNSFLPDKHIAQAKRIPFWTSGHASWSKESVINYFAQPLDQYPQLQAKLIQEYIENHLNPTLNLDNRMRRLVCIIERLDFEEINYKLGEKYTNKQDSTNEHIFRFCQYPVDGKGLMIYEDDYPLNACGCFGEKCACNCGCCCSIL